MHFTRLAHVCLHVKSLQRSLDYYHKLGFANRFKFTRRGSDYGMYLEIAPMAYIEMFEEPGMGRAQNAGLAHFCLETENLDALMAHLDKEGVAYTPKKQGCDHTWQIWLEDPDGNKFEVHQYSANSLQQKGGVVEADW
jgi:catechol 2,3-dioxygenase-like lactoylglutathione lyase family enzyme